MQPTASFTGERRFLARGAAADSGAAPLAEPIGAEAPRDAFCHTEISASYGVSLHPILDGVARHARLGPQTAAQAKPSNAN